MRDNAQVALSRAEVARGAGVALALRRINEAWVIDGDVSHGTRRDRRSRYVP